MGRIAFRKNDFGVLMAASEASIQQQRMVRTFAAQEARRKFRAAAAKWMVGGPGLLLGGR